MNANGQKPNFLCRRIDAYRARYRLTRAWSFMQAILFWGLAAAALCFLVDKLLYLDAGYSTIALSVASLGLLALLALYVATPVSRHMVCYLVDRHADLKNLVSTGLSVAADPTEAAAVVVARADAALSGRSPRALMPFEWNRAGRLLYVPALLLALCLLMPDLDLIGRKKASEKAAADQALVQEGAMKLAAKMISIQTKYESIGSIEAGKIAGDFNALTTNMLGVPPKEALLKLGEFENKYREEFSEQRDFEKAARAFQPSPDMRGLAPETQEQLSKLLQNLKGGNFEEAGDALRELSAQLNNKDLSQDQKKALAREMRKVAEKMQGAGAGEKMADLLRQIESSPMDAADLLKQCESASKEMAELANFCDESDGLKSMKEGLAEAKQKMLGDSFSGFDPKEVEDYMAGEASLGNAGKGSGPGTGGEGRGRGGLPLENMTDTSFDSQVSPSKINKGKILHQIFVSGVPEKGDAPAEYADVLKAAKEYAAGSLARDRIPREYEDMVKTYFDSLEMEKNEATP